MPNEFDRLKRRRQRRQYVQDAAEISVARYVDVAVTVRPTLPEPAR
jgi:hypothetical protein